MIFTPWRSLKYGDSISFRHGSTRVIVESQKFVFMISEGRIAYTGGKKKLMLLAKQAMFSIYSIKTP